MPLVLAITETGSQTHRERKGVKDARDQCVPPTNGILYQTEYCSTEASHE